MILKIYNDPEEKPTEPEIFLRLTKGSLTDIQDTVLRVVDKGGRALQGGVLLSISPKGEVKRVPYVNDKLGLLLDEKQRIVIQ